MPILSQVAARPQEPPEPAPGTCRCGSGEFAYWINDGHGIPLAKVCDECEAKTLKKYRPDILGQYECDEPIDADY